ncbi:GTPase-activating protein gyp8 [Dispira parvispora]|uniref:GTPase-activating protein gyp8 n=1 Tax=Dispira parvispora TaxID=1520584 RepID=A0A9W8E8F1_9FUNG|nr:GTPase-activating protein gyp8 [Dispira parvispora]
MVAPPLPHYSPFPERTRSRVPIRRPRHRAGRFVKRRHRQCYTCATQESTFTRRKNSLALTPNQSITSLVDYRAIQRRACQPTQGFETNLLRRVLWPLVSFQGLLHVTTWPVPTHADETVLRLDIGRTHFPLNPHQQSQLETLLAGVLRRHPWLHYYQGLNDVCTVFLLVLGEKLALGVCERVLLLYFRDFMSRDFHHVHTFLGCIYSLIQAEDTALYQRIIEVELPPYFATSWLLTWFSHDIAKVDLIYRLFDYFLTRHPLMSVYFSAALVLGQSGALMHLEPEFPSWHKFLLDAPGQLTMVELQGLIVASEKLWKRYPPEKHFARGFHPYSCVSTYPKINTVNTALQYGVPIDLDFIFIPLDSLSPPNVQSSPSITTELSAADDPKVSQPLQHPLDLAVNARDLQTTWPSDEKGLVASPGIHSLWVATMDRLKQYVVHNHRNWPQVSNQTFVAVAVYTVAFLVVWFQSTSGH